MSGKVVSRFPELAHLNPFAAACIFPLYLQVTYPQSGEGVNINNPFRTPKPLPSLIPRNFVPKNGFPL